MGSKRRRRKTRDKARGQEEPFILLTIKVGFSLLCIGWVVTHIVIFISYSKTQWTALTSSQHSPHTVIGAMDVLNSARDATKLPIFQLDPQRLNSDAFGIQDTVAKLLINHQSSVGSINDFHGEARRLKEQFTTLYGGENAARYLIHSGIFQFRQVEETGHVDIIDTIFDTYDIQNIPMGLKHTAYRIIRAKQQKRPFKISFAGYSVTVGRGNYFNQSYPFVLQRLLTKPMELLGIELQVRNAAIGGVPSFPYGWCLKNFLGDDADVISWDYSMNEAGGVADGMEAYIRHGLSMKRQPMLIIKDTSVHIAQDRYDLLQSYVDTGILKDPIVLNIEDTINSFLQVRKESIPNGFRDWREFGAPKGSPGQTSHHPGVKEHELYGWLLTMHFLAALELVALFVSKEGSDAVLVDTDMRGSPTNQIMLPAPFHGKNIAPRNLFSLFYGSEVQNDNVSKYLSWKINPVYCRTTYDPILSNNLQDIVVSGSLGEDIDIMKPKGSQMYNKGWVLDLGESEKTAKKKLQRHGGLGYIDSKKAYYGIKASGLLELFLPCIGRDDIAQKVETSMEGVPAKYCFGNVVVCEVNEKHSGSECNLQTDLAFQVDGIKSAHIESVNATGASYWGRNICIRVDVPPDASLSQHENRFGISLAISVASSSVLLRTGPCSISHVIWEQNI